MPLNRENKNVLYIFGGEKAQGAEIVIERLMSFNTAQVNPILLIAPGAFATFLLAQEKPYQIIVCKHLRKLNRSESGTLNFLGKALKNYVMLSFSILRCIHQYKIDIVHANTIVPAVYSLPLVSMLSITRPALRWMWTDHDMMYFSRMETRLSNLCVRNYDDTIVVSNAVKRKYPKQERITVLYNGLDLKLFRKDVQRGQHFRQLHGLPATALVFGMAASICPGKGQMGLIDAFKLLSASRGDAYLLLAGAYAEDDKAYNAQVTEAIAGLSNVIHTGQVMDMLAFYNACDVVISNSNAHRSESLGTSIYEAMACERIVVASATGGTPEIIDDHKNGFLFKADDLQELFQTMLRALKSLSSQEGIGKAARLKVQRVFSIEQMANSYNQIIYKHPETKQIG